MPQRLVDPAPLPQHMPHSGASPGVAPAQPPVRLAQVLFDSRATEASEAIAAISNEASQARGLAGRYTPTCTRAGWSWPWQAFQRCLNSCTQTS